MPWASRSLRSANTVTSISRDTTSMLLSMSPSLPFTVTTSGIILASSGRILLYWAARPRRADSVSGRSLRLLRRLILRKAMTGSTSMYITASGLGAYLLIV